VLLSKLTVDVRSREFRRDYADIHHMHRTVMSAFPDIPGDTAYRQNHRVLWRIDTTTNGFLCYVQSRTQPDWTSLPAGYLIHPAETRSLQPVLDTIRSGRKLAFRLVGNPTRVIHPGGIPGARGRGKRVLHREPDKQIEWLVRKGEQHGFVIPTAADGKPDVAPSPCQTSTGTKQGDKPAKITVEPVRFDGYLIVTDNDAFTDAVTTGIGRAKAYGCGLISLASARNRS
jgi:CRISPR system Cascade subunit CasE